MLWEFSPTSTSFVRLSMRTARILLPVFKNGETLKTCGTARLFCMPAYSPFTHKEDSRWGRSRVNQTIFSFQEAGTDTSFRYHARSEEHTSELQSLRRIS